MSGVSAGQVVRGLLVGVALFLALAQAARLAGSPADRSLVPVLSLMVAAG